MIHPLQACAECPASYEADPASGLLCSLWLELENKEMEAEGGDLDGDLGGDLVSTTANLGSVTCVYGGHDTSAGDLCDLWCQIQLLEVGPGVIIIGDCSLRNRYLGRSVSGGQ